MCGGMPYLPEHLCRDDVHFVHEQQAPLPAANLVHDACAFLTALATKGDHGVGGDAHPAHSRQALLLIRCEPASAKSWSAMGGCMGFAAR